MQRNRDLPVRRALTDRRQLLGFVPTFAFWNDGERQRLVLPIVALVALPVTPLLFVLVAQLQLSVWLLLVGSTLYPYLVMGLVERHIRKELRRRSRETGLVPLAESPSKALGRTLPVTLAALCLLMATLALFDASKAVMLVALVVGVAGSLVAASLPRTRRVANELGAAQRGEAIQLPGDATGASPGATARRR